MNKDAVIRLVNEQMWTKTDVPSFQAGDTITVTYKIVEGNKERLQSFRGVVIQIKGTGKTKMFTIRKISNGIGVERIFPLYSPHIESIEVNKQGVVRRARIYYLRNLTGKKAPEWTLNDIKERPVSLSDLKSKVILVNITGIGCGACQASIPFLKELKRKYQEEDFELVAIESWSRMHSLQNYAKRKELNYMFLDGDDKVIEDYRTGGAAPYFFILDKERIIRKVIRGYGMGKTDKEITEAIEELL